MPEITDEMVQAAMQAWDRHSSFMYLSDRWRKEPDA